MTNEFQLYLTDKTNLDFYCNYILCTGVPQKFDEMSTLVRAVQEPPDIHSKL